MRGMRSATVLLAVLFAACSKHETPAMQNADTLTQRQKDSVVGASGLPGSQGIAKAQKAQDDANARTARSDSITRADSL